MSYRLRGIVPDYKTTITDTEYRNLNEFDREKYEKVTKAKADKSRRDDKPEQPRSESFSTRDEPDGVGGGD